MAHRSRLLALGLSLGTLAGLVAGMWTSNRPSTPPPASSTVSPAEPDLAEPPPSPFAGQRSITQTGAS